FWGSFNHKRTQSGRRRSPASIKLGARSVGSLPGGSTLLVGWQLVHFDFSNRSAPVFNRSGVVWTSVEINGYDTLSTAAKYAPMVAASVSVKWNVGMRNVNQGRSLVRPGSTKNGWSHRGCVLNPSVLRFGGARARVVALNKARTSPP